VSKTYNNAELKINLVQGEVREEQVRADSLSDCMLSDLVKIASDVANLQQTDDHVSANSSEAQARVRLRKDDVNPRVSPLDLKVTAFTTAIKSMFHSAGTSDSLTQSMILNQKPLKENVLMNCNAFDGIRCISHGKCKF
jgi:hypothetical protein